MSNPYFLKPIEGSTMINRRDQLRGEYEVRYQQEGRPDPSAGPEGAHEGLDDPSVDPDPSTFPSRLVLLLAYLSASKQCPK